MVLSWDNIDPVLLDRQFGNLPLFAYWPKFFVKFNMAKQNTYVSWIQAASSQILLQDLDRMAQWLWAQGLESASPGFKFQ